MGKPVPESLLDLSFKTEVLVRVKNQIRFMIEPVKSRNKLYIIE